jgi:transposase-like protein
VKKWWQRVKDHHPRQRYLKTPKDCPHCCCGLRLETARISGEVRPWREVKSKRGRKKKYATQGYACLNPACAHFGHTNESIHALVRHATRGKDKDIPYLCCQACQTVFSSRKGTPLYYLKTKPERMEMVVWFQAEGVDYAVVVRYTGHKDATIACWLERMGQHSEGLHNVLFRGLVLKLVQLDELYAKVRDSEQARWLWLTIDPITKVIPSPVPVFLWLRTIKNHCHNLICINRRKNLHTSFHILFQFPRGYLRAFWGEQALVASSIAPRYSWQYPIIIIVTAFLLSFPVLASLNLTR